MNVHKGKNQSGQRKQTLKEKLEGRLHACLEDHWYCRNDLLIFQLLSKVNVLLFIICVFLVLVVHKRPALNDGLVQFGERRQRKFEEKVKVNLECTYIRSTHHLIYLLNSLLKTKSSHIIINFLIWISVESVIRCVVIIFNRREYFGSISCFVSWHQIAIVSKPVWFQRRVTDRLYR